MSEQPPVTALFLDGPLAGLNRTQPDYPEKFRHHVLPLARYGETKVYTYYRVLVTLDGVTIATYETRDALFAPRPLWMKLIALAYEAYELRNKGKPLT